jgi:hypothetical protein
MKLFCLRWFCKWFWYFFWSMWAHCLCSCSLIYIVFTFDFAITSFGKTNQRHPTPHDWKASHLFSWSPKHSPFGLGIHLWIILILINFVWLHRAGMRWWSTRFVLFWICIQIGWYYKWTSIMLSILYHGQPFFRNYNLLPILLDQYFPFVWWF